MSTKRMFKKIWLKTLVFMLCISLVFTASPVFAIEGTNGVSVTPVEEKDAEILYEIVDDRTATQKVFRLDDGSYMTAQYEYDIHYEGDDGWENIDNTLINSAATDSNDFAGVEAENGKRAVKFANNTASGKVLRIKNGNAKIVWTVPNANKSKGQFVQPEGSQESADANDKYIRLNKSVTQAIYPNVWDGVDLRYTVMGSSIKEEIIINNALDGYDFEFELELKKSSLTQNADGSLTISDVDGNELYTIPAPFMTDASGRYSEAVEYEVTVISEKNNKATYRISVVADADWINSDDTVFPVVVDPTVTVNQNDSNFNIEDYTVYSGQPDVSSNTDLLYVGSIYGNARTYIKLNTFNIPLKPNDKLVGVYLGVVYIYNNLSNTSGTVEIRECTDWVDNPTWNNQPSYSNEILDYIQYDKSPSNADYSYESYDGLTYYYKQAYLDLTDLYDKPTDDPVDGIVLKMPDEYQANDYLTFGSINGYSTGEGAIYPRLTYVTKNFIGLEGYWSTHTQSVGESGVGYVNDYTRGLTYAYNDFSIGGEYASMGITHYYNSAYRNAKYTGVATQHGVVDSSLPLPVYSANYGNGWHLNSQQSVVLMSTTMQNAPGTEQPLYQKYVYVDADGTYHWFNSEDEDDANNNNYIDEDGLGLTLTVSDNAENLYVIKDKDNNQLLFNDDGVLVKSIDRNGNATTYTYDNDGQLISITDASGRSVALAYIGANLIAITDTAGRSTTYQYSTTYNSTDYSTTGNFLRKIVRPDDSYTEFSYSSTGALTRVYDSASDYSISYINFMGEVCEYYEQMSGVDGKHINIAQYYYTTVFVDSGRDAEFGTGDEIETYYCFDRYGRTTSTYTEAEGTVYSAACEYTNGIADFANNPNDARKVNKLKTDTMTGGTSFNLLTNGSFERDLYGWNASLNSNCVGAINSSSSYNFFGTKSLKIGSSGTSATTGKYEHTAITLPAGDYTLSAYVKTVGFESTSGGAYIKIGSNRSTYVSTTTSTQINNGWKRLTVSLTLSSQTTVYATVGITSSKGTAYFDGVQLETDSYGDYNLLENGTFDEGTYGWDGNTYQIATNYSGRSNLLRLDGSPNETKSVMCISSNITPSTEYSYIVSGWAKANASNGFNNDATFAIEVLLQYTDNTSDSFRFNFNPVYTEWQNITGIAVPKQGKTVNTVVVYLIYDYNINSCYFDDICLTRGEASCYTYDENGNVTQVVSNSQNTTTMSYSGNNITAVTDEDGTSTYTYDSNNNVTSATTVGGLTTNYNYNQNGTLSNANATNGSKTIYTSYVYSDSGNYVTSVTGAMGTTSYSSYDEDRGLLLSTTDANGNVTEYTYDDENDLLTDVAAGYGDGTREVSYEYNAKKQLSKITHNGFDYNLSYDYYHGGLEEVNIGTRNLSTNYYDMITGELYYSQYGNGWNKVYSYDTLGRLVSINSADMNANQTYAITNYKYNKLGQLAEFYDSLSGITSIFDYDALGRLTSTVTSDGSLDSQYFYNAKGQLSNRQYQGFSRIYKTQNFSYNSDGYLTSMHDDPAITTNTIDQFGRVTQLDLFDTTSGNTVYTNSYTYLAGSGGANATTTLVGTESISGFGSYNYSYLPNGNMYWVTANRNGTSYDVSYEYDDLGQLITESNFYTNQTVYYTYDAGGNITSKQTYDGVWWTLDESSLVTDTYTYGDSQWKDLLTAYNGQAITYDEIGNPLTYKNGETMTWVNGRRLFRIEFDDSSEVVEYSYDSNGMRLRKEGPLVDSYNYSYTNNDLFYIDYYYDGDTLIYERRSGNGNNASERFTIEYLYGVNGITGFRIHQGNTTTDYFYVKNIMGDVLGIMNSNGTLVAEYRYDAYGNPVQILDGNGNDVSNNYAHIANINPIRYRGYYYDIESGFYYLNSRYYDPEIGRFINADSYVSTGQDINGFNMFAYCGNNPVMRKDPSGQRWDIVVCAKIGANIGISTYIEYISKNPIKHDVPHYQQHTGVDCGAFCHAMIDTYKNKESIDPEKAWKKALDLEGSLFEPKFPTNMDASSPVFKAGDNKIKLSLALQKGPLYGLYSFNEVSNDSKIDSHLVVITGYDPINGIVYINDPAMSVSIQVSYEDFLTGYNSSRGMYFVGAYEPY